MSFPGSQSRDKSVKWRVFIKEYPWISPCVRVWESRSAQGKRSWCTQANNCVCPPHRSLELEWPILIALTQAKVAGPSLNVDFPGEGAWPWLRGLSTNEAVPKGLRAKCSSGSKSFLKGVSVPTAISLPSSPASVSEREKQLSCDHS